jgi:PAS domain S-box-containing protein
VSKTVHFDAPKDDERRRKEVRFSEAFSLNPRIDSLVKKTLSLLANVEVEGSNPLARSKIFQIKSDTSAPIRRHGQHGTCKSPSFMLSRFFKAIAAIASIGTGIYLIRLRRLIITLAETAKTAALRSKRLEKQALDLIEVNQSLQQEIVDHRHAENELRKSEEHFRITLDAIEDYAVFLLDLTGHVVNWNEGARRIKQYTKDEIIGQHFSIFYPEEDVKAGKPARELRETIATGRFEEEGWKVRKDGTRFWANVVMNSIRDPKTGELKGFSKITRDITERRRAAEELRHAHENLEKRVEERTIDLRQSEKSFRYLADAMPQLVWMAHGDGHIFWLNQRWYDYTGMTPKDVLEWGWQSVQDPGELPRVRDAWRTALEAKEPFEQTFPLKSASGKYRWFLARIIPIKNEEGDVLRWIGAHTDVNDLREAREAAENAARLKSRFLEIAAHELRTPVAAFSLLLQFSQMKLEKDDRPVSLSILAKLRAQADRLSRLVVDLLDVSRLERGVLKLKEEPTDIAALVTSCLESFRLQSPNRSFTLTQPEQPVKIYVDPVRIYQVISNLIDNATKYTPENEPIEITFKATSRFVTVSIKDHGVGIPVVQRAALFQPFSRGTSDREERTSGLGLGLFISKNIIDLHHGTIRVISEGGEGTTFSFDLPRKDA